MKAPSRLEYVAGEAPPKAPRGKEYILKSEFTVPGILLAIFCFPIGICCLLFMRKRYWLLVTKQRSPKHPGATHRKGNESDFGDVELGAQCGPKASARDYGAAVGYIQQYVPSSKSVYDGGIQQEDRGEVVLPSENQSYGGTYCEIDAGGSTSGGNIGGYSAYSGGADAGGYSAYSGGGDAGGYSAYSGGGFANNYSGYSGGGDAGGYSGYSGGGDGGGYSGGGDAGGYSGGGD